MRTILASAACAALLVISESAGAFVTGHDTGGVGNQGAYTDQTPGDSGHDAGDNSGSGSGSRGRGPLYPGSGSGNSQGGTNDAGVASGFGGSGGDNW